MLLLTRGFDTIKGRQNVGVGCMIRRYSFLIISVLSAVLLSYVNCSGGFDAIKEVASSSAGIPDPGTVKVFMATGHMGRTIMSCDDGQSWIKDRSVDDTARCWVEQTNPKYVECDHTPYSAQGIDYGDGYIYADYGWGFPGSIKRSSDGVNWQIVRSGGSGGSVAYSGGTLFSPWNGWSLSTDKGLTWATVENAPDETFDFPQVHRVGTRFFITSRTNGIARSLDQGRTWNIPAGFESNSASTVAGGNGLIVTAGFARGAGPEFLNKGYISRSRDGGVTFTSQKVFEAQGMEWTTNLVFTGTHFVIYSAGQQWKSTDAINWTKTDMVLTGSANRLWWNGPLAYNPSTQTFVSVIGTWGWNYERQVAYRSTDGVTFTELAADKFKGGHPIRKIIIGEMPASFCQ